MLLTLAVLALASLCNARNVSLVLLKEAVNEGAVCLDGSAPGYYIGKGSGNGTNKWILHQGGGGWCNSTLSCLIRSNTSLGSSLYWNSTVDIGGIFSNNETVNGEFYNWNIIYLNYCDGGSFSGYRKDPIVVNETKLYFRGKAILLALVQHLLQNGMSDATDVILTGCSAGGLATYLHADLVPTLLPKGIKYRAMADAGYFLNAPNVNGVMGYEYYMKAVHALHNTSGGSNADCVAHFTGPDEWKCLFAPYTFQFIKSPIFVLNSLYDTAQLNGILGLKCLPPNCSPQQMKFFDNFRNEFLAQLAPALNSSSTGVFADSCLIHCQTLPLDEPWATYSVGGQTMRETFEDWYFGKTSAKYKEVDCPFPCNPTCPVPKLLYGQKEFLNYTPLI